MRREDMMMNPSDTRPMAPVSGQPVLGVEMPSGGAPRLEADPVGPDELASMLAELDQIDVEKIVPAAAFDPRWPEVERS